MSDNLGIAILEAKQASALERTRVRVGGALLSVDQDRRGAGNHRGAALAGRMSDRHAPGLLGGVGLAMPSVGMASLTMLPVHPRVIDVCLRMRCAAPASVSSGRRT